MTDEIQRVHAEELQRVLNKALHLPLPDAVFVIVHYNLHIRTMGPRPHSEQIPLTALDKLGSTSELDAWQSKARALRRDAYVAGEALLRDKARYDTAKDRMIREHPGFGNDTYDAAISFGCLQAR